MNKKKTLSLIVMLSLFLSLFQPIGSTVLAEDIDYFESSQLTINGEATTWSVTGTRSTTFGDRTAAPNGFEYYSATDINFTLTKALSELEAGTYEFSIELFSEQATPGPQAAFIIETSEGQFSTPISYTGSSWNTPAKLSINNIAVGEDGVATINVQMISSGEHYGYLHNIQLIKGESSSVGQAKVSPNSAILRPNATQQLQTVLEAGQMAIYRSTEETIATVSSTGEVTAVSDGETTIVADIYENEELIASGSSTVYVSSTLQSDLNAEIAVQPVAELQSNNRDDFMMGADISMLHALSEVGRKFYNTEGEEQQLVDILQDAGVNWVRLRAWVDPTDGQGNSYGAGNVDTNTMVSMAQQAKAAGLNVLVDLHYSDFWADPGRQNTPKAWANLTAAELEQQVYDYTYETLEALYDANVYPDMIQVGNEINDGLLWPLGKGVQGAKPYLASGIKAVRDFETDKSGEHIDIVLHRANPNDGVNRVSSFYATYNDLDYDVIGLSYYPFWHGSLQNLQTVMDSLAAQYNKKVAVVETSYAYTLEDTILNGETAHVFGEAQVKEGGYLATVQGQASALRDVIAAVAKVPNEQGVGIFYWEPSWLMGTDTGWGTTHAASYQKESIPTDGGSGWANQGLFNYFGEALPSLYVFDQVRESDDTYTEPTLVAVEDIEITTSQTVYVAPPTKVKALFSDDTYREVNVTEWSPSKYDVELPGSHTLIGKLSTGDEVVANVVVRPYNYVVNPGYESSDMSAWTLIGSERSNEAKFSGSYAVHFWNKSEVSAKQTVTNLPDGIYELSVQTRIGIEGDPIADTSKLYARAGEQEYSEPLVVTGWDAWRQIKIENIKVEDGQLEIGAIVYDAIGDYGDFDDWELIRTGTLETTPSPSPNPNPNPSPTTEPIIEQTIYPLSKEQLNGVNVWKAMVNAGDTKATIDISVALQASETDVVVLQWGDRTIELSLEQLAAIVKGKKDSTITVEWSKLSNNASVKPNGSAGAAVSLAGQPFALSIIAGEDVSEVYASVTLPLSAEADPTKQWALYEIDLLGTLHYVGGKQIDGKLHAIISNKASYVIAAVTRQYPDVLEQSEALKKLTAIGVIQGDANGKANLDQSLTRAELSKMITSMLDLEGNSEARQLNLAISVSQASEETYRYVDVSSSHWASSYIQLMSQQGWLMGTGNERFAPAGKISYEQLYAIAARVLDLDISDITEQQTTFAASQWAAPYIQALLEVGVLSPDQATSLNFQDEVTREAAFELLYQLLAVIEQ